MSEVYPELREAIMRELRPLQGGLDSAAGRRRIRQLPTLIERAVKRAYQQQLQTRYKFLVGEWRGRHRAKSTVTGAFVRNAEVVDYLRESGEEPE